MELIGSPGAKNHGASPFWTVAEVGADAGGIDECNILRCNGWDQAISQLCIAHIGGHFLVKGGIVEVVQDGRRRQMSLLQPSQLFAGGTVAQHAHGVAENGVVDKRTEKS